jgi:hypothetical protein
METAIVGIFGALIGILLSNVLRVYFDWRNRRERARDIQTALRAEIRSHRHALEDFDDEDGIAEVASASRRTRPSSAGRSIRRSFRRSSARFTSSPAVLLTPWCCSTGRPRALRA